MDIDSNDVKIIVHTCLQFMMNSCCGYLKDHPLVPISGLFSLLLYIFIPSLFYIFLYTFPLVISASIFLGGGVSSRDRNIDLSEPVTEENSPRLTKNHRFPSIKQGSVKLSRPCIQACMSRRTFKRRCERANETDTDDDLEMATLMREFEMLAKTQADENENRDSPCSTDVLSEDVDVYLGEEVKEESPIKLDNFNQSGEEDSTKLDIEFKVDDEKEGSPDLRKTNFIVEWTEEDQKNMMELGSSEDERNQRLESLIAKRKARKSIYPQRYYLKFGYNNVDQSHVSSIMIGRVSTDNDDESGYHQPGSAPSVLLPARNPFDLPYDPSEERPDLSGDDDGFHEEFLFPQQAKDMQHYCRHQSFNYGAWLMGDFNDETFAKSLTGYLSKPKALETSRPSKVKRESGKNGQIGSDSQDQLIPLPPKSKDWKKSDGLSQKDNSTSCEETTHFSEPKIEEESNFKEISHRQAKGEHNQENEDNVVDVQPMLTSTDESETNQKLLDEVASSSSSSKLTSSEDVFNVVKNEALGNSVLKVLTDSTPRNEDDAVEETYNTTYSPSLSSGFLGDSIPTSMHPTKTEERSFYTDKSPLESADSIASDMLVELSEPGRPPINKGEEPSWSTDRESLICGEGVNKNINSGAGELSVASSHPVQLEEQGTGSPEFEGSNLSTSTSSPRSMMAEENEGPMMDADHTETNEVNQQDIIAYLDDTSSVSSSSEHLGQRVQSQSRLSKENLNNYSVSEVDSTRIEEKFDYVSGHVVINSDGHYLPRIEQGDQQPVSAKNGDQRFDSQDQRFDSQVLGLWTSQNLYNLASSATELNSDGKQIPTDSSSSTASTSRENATLDEVTSAENQSNSAHEASRDLPDIAQRFSQYGEDFGFHSPILPAVDHDPTTTDGVDDNSSFSPISVLHETNTHDDITTSLTNDTINDQPPSVTTVTGHNYSNEIPQNQESPSRIMANMSPLERLHDPSFQAISPELPSEQADDVTDSVLSPKSVLRMISSMDDIPSTSEQNTVTESHHYDEASGSNDSSNSISHEGEQQQQQQQQPQDCSVDDIPSTTNKLNTVMESHQYDEAMLSDHSPKDLSHEGEQQQPRDGGDSSEKVQISYDDSVSYKLQPEVASESVKSCSEESGHSNVVNDPLHDNHGSGEEEKQQVQSSPRMNQSKSVEATQESKLEPSSSVGEANIPSQEVLVNESIRQDGSGSLVEGPLSSMVQESLVESNGVNTGENVEPDVLVEEKDGLPRPTVETSIPSVHDQPSISMERVANEANVVVSV